MARRHKHEEHANHEAWAIPYGDLITLLLAFFVVMYAMSSVNEGKYRVLSDSLQAAFQGAPKSMQPIQIGQKQVGSGADINMSIVQQAVLEGQPRELFVPPTILEGAPTGGAHDRGGLSEDLQPAPGESPTGAGPGDGAAGDELETVAIEVERAMADLIEKDLIIVRRKGAWVEVEIRTDILFPSGIATLSPNAVDVVQRLADTLRPFPNPIRVEGHTDNRPISTRAFPSNWELSSARAASVVHLFTRAGVDPARLAVIGLGEHRPAQSNDTPEGRNANRRVLLVILNGPGRPEGERSNDTSEATPEAAPDAPPAVITAATTPISPAP